MSNIGNAKTNRIKNRWKHTAGTQAHPRKTNKSSCEGNKRNIESGSSTHKYKWIVAIVCAVFLLAVITYMLYADPCKRELTTQLFTVSACYVACATLGFAIWNYLTIPQENFAIYNEIQDLSFAIIAHGKTTPKKNQAESVQ